MKANGKRRHGSISMRVEAKRARRKSDNKYPFLDLDFVDEEPLSIRQRILYGLGALGCIILAVIGAIFPVLPAIPFWILAVICLSHSFPGFGRFVRNTRLYKWLIRKLNEPEKKAKRPVMKRRDKDVIMMRLSMGIVLFIIANFVLCARLEAPPFVKWLISAIASITWIASWLYLYFYVREPEATIKTGR